MIENEDIISLYKEVVDEYNKSPLAVGKSGFVHKINNHTLVEIKQILKYFPKKNGLLLDIGTGSGIIPRLIKKIGGHAISVDSILSADGDAIKNVRLAGVEGFFTDILTESLPIQSSTIDVVFLGDVLEHLIHSPKHPIKEIYRVLKPGGSIVASTPNALRLTVRLKVLLGYSNWPNIEDYYNEKFHHGHHHEYTIDEFKNVFLNEGFIIENLLLHEENLQSTHIANLDDIRSGRRNFKKKIKSEFFVISIAKKICYLITCLFPKLKGSMILVAKVPFNDKI